MDRRTHNLGSGEWTVVGATAMLAAFTYKLFYIRRREQAPALHWIDIFPRCPIFTQVCVFLREFHWEVVRKRQLQHPKQWVKGGRSRSAAGGGGSEAEESTETSNEPVGSGRRLRLRRSFPLVGVWG